MSDTEDGEVNDGEQMNGNEKANGDENGMESEVEIVAEDITAKQYFEFALPTRSWGLDTSPPSR